MLHLPIQNLQILIKRLKGERLLLYLNSQVN